MAINLDQKPGESDLQYYKRLAKTADQRMVRLERYAEEDNFKTAVKWAYAKASKDAVKWGGTEEKPRFNIKPPENKTALKSKIRDIKTFLEKPTSTKKGITEVYKKKADTINKRYGTNFNWQSLGKYYESGLADKLEKTIDGSKSVLRTIGKFQQQKKQVLDAINKIDKTVLKVEDDDVQSAIDSALKDNNISASELISLASNKEVQKLTGIGSTQADKNFLKLTADQAEEIERIFKK